MPESLREQFDKIILEKYYHDKPSLADRETAELNGLRDRRKTFKAILDSDPDFYVLYNCANLSATWLSLLAAVLVEELAESNEQDEPHDEQVAGLAFFSRLANDLWAIIELVEIGFDLQARALTRSYLEHVDVLICCIHDRALTTEFINAVEPEASNAFWHKYVSKNKAKLKVSNFISLKIGRADSRVVDRMREDAEITGSILHHPTVTGGLMTAFGHEDVDYDSYPIYPVPLPASVGVFRAVLIHLFWLWFAMEGLPKASGGDWRALIRSRRLFENDTIDRYSRIHSDMFGFLLEHQLLMKVEE